MFDTVKLYAKNVVIHPNKFRSMHGVKKDGYIKEETAEIIRSYQLSVERIPYIKYYESSRTLYVQVSIPKFLYGDNITMLKEADILRFFDLLQAKLMELFDVKIEHSEWIATRIDVCHNFKVDSVSNYIKQIAKLTLPYKKTYVIGHDETVEFKNHSSQIRFYDKYKQCGDDRAIGMLRFEIEVSKDDMKKHSATRKAVELLNQGLFNEQVKKVLPYIRWTKGIKQAISMEWLLANDLNKIERYIGLTVLIQELGEGTVKQLYGSNYYRKRKLLQEMIPHQVKTYNLNIDLDNIG